jgi:serine/threonine-protein kinase RsbW
MTTKLQVTADARPDCIRPLRNLVEELASDTGFSDAEAYAIKVCVNEALANAVQHAHPRTEPGSVRLSLREDGQDFEVAVADEGRGCHEMHDGEGDLHLGLMLITRLSKHCTLTAAPDGTKVEMVFARPHHERRRDSPPLTHFWDLDAVFRHAA